MRTPFLERPRVFHATIPALMLATSLLCASVEARPVPVDVDTISVRYMTDAGPQFFSGDRDFSGVNRFNAPSLGGAPNITAFNAANEFGRRWAVSGNPMFADVWHPNESLITHAVFKRIGHDNEAFFPGIVENSDITVQVTDVQFDQPVTLDTDTLLLHVLWVTEHADAVGYHHGHNVHTFSANFRELDEFHLAGEFAEHPVPNFALADDHIEWTLGGQGTNTLSISARFPYHLLRSLEEGEHGSHMVPEGLPAPHGFLEPFHFHIEYAVTPEPASLLLLAIVAWAVGRRRS